MQKLVEVPLFVPTPAPLSVVILIPSAVIPIPFATRCDPLFPSLQTSKKHQDERRGAGESRVPERRISYSSSNKGGGRPEAPPPGPPRRRAPSSGPALEPAARRWRPTSAMPSRRGTGEPSPRGAGGSK